MPNGEPRASYRDELGAAYARIADLEQRNRDLQDELTRGAADVVPAEHVRDLDATLRRWDRLRAMLAMLLGSSGLLALLVAERWDVHVALLTSCSAMVAVGITLAWPQVVRARPDPKPHARDVSLWRSANAVTRMDGVRVDTTDAGAISEPPPLVAEVTVEESEPATLRRVQQ